MPAASYASSKRPTVLRCIQRPSWTCDDGPWRTSNTRVVRGEQSETVGMSTNMPSYAAFLRGVSPMNAKMSELRSAFESAGFTDVRTILSSGNVVFSARKSSEASLQRKAEEAMVKRQGRAFLTIIRSIDSLREMLATDPYGTFGNTPGAKRIVTFLLREPKSKLKLPIELDGARILAVRKREVFTTYVRTPKGPVFMTLIQKTFGNELTTRTWDTVAKVAR
jgi:uncharacterized protein (DUF1697 family)